MGRERTGQHVQTGEGLRVRGRWEGAREEAVKLGSDEDGKNVGESTEKEDLSRGKEQGENGQRVVG